MVVMVYASFIPRDWQVFGMVQIGGKDGCMNTFYTVLNNVHDLKLGVTALFSYNH